MVRSGTVLAFGVTVLAVGEVDAAFGFGVTVLAVDGVEAALGVAVLA
jgi:hypothetical protein